MFPELALREGWVTVICLLLVLLCVAWTIQVAGWTDGLSILQGVVILGGVVGIVLAKSRVPSRLAHLLSAMAGFAWGLYLTSGVLARAEELSAQAAVVGLEQRLRVLVQIPFNQGLKADNFVFLALLAILMWVLAYFCAWAIFRWQRVWWVVMICGLAMMLNINYSSARLTGFLIAFLLFALLLVVRASLAFYEHQWRAARISYSPELVSTCLQAGLVVSIVAILIAWLAPVALASRPLQPFWDKVGEPWRRFQDYSSRVFEDLNYQNEPPLIPLGDRRMWFGGAVELTDTPILDVEAAAGRYWRVMVFHEYLSNGWVNTDPDTILLDENEETLAFPELELRHEVTQTMVLQRARELADALVAAGQPLRASVPTRATVTFVTHEDDLIHAPDGSVFPPAPGDPSALYSRLSLPAGGTYEVLSSLSQADEESLREAGTGYPSWVVPRYLQLADSLPERVRLLAEQVTAGTESAYDSAKAVEDYLRSIPYNEKIDPPSPGQDGVDYFLFEVQEGYCQYFSSAMVVMLRAVGIPARYVQGYSQGQSEEGVYHLLEQDGHAWPEVYFPGYGWVEFEPTSGEPVLVRPRTQDEETEDRPQRGPEREPPQMDDMADDQFDRGDIGPEPVPQSRSLWQRIGWGGGLGFSFLAFGLVAFAAFMIRRRRQIHGLSVAERVYEDLVDWVRRLLRLDPLAHQTPHEYAGAVVQTMPRGREAVERIADLYVQERFGAKEIPSEAAEAAWQQAWSAIWRRWLGRKVEAVQRLWWRLVPPEDMAES
jgi:transglutaminase-like putative cysteine protease